jgi:hypothetical protein
MAFDRSLKTTINDVAQIYDGARPGYPGQLGADVIPLRGFLVRWD